MFRKWHRIGGLFSAVFVLMLSITGLLLNHPSFLGDHKNQIQHVFSSPFSKDELWVLDKKSLYIADQNYKKKFPISLSYPPSNILDVCFFSSENITDDKKVFIAYKNNMILQLIRQNPLIWEDVLMPKNDYSQLQSLQCLQDGLILKTEKALYFKKYDSFNWQLIESYPFSFKQFVKGLHTGYYFKPFLLIFNDFAAIILVLLVFTGFFLLKKKKKNY